MKKYDYIILGAGISGLSFARMLQQQTTKTFLVLEKENEPGGLCRSKNVDGNWFDTGGGHFLCSKHQQVYDFIFSHIPENNFTKHERITKIKIHDTYIDYPIEDNLWQLPAEIQIKYLHSIIKGINEKEPENFEQWITKNLGSEIYNNYLKPYNEKLWGVSVSEMDTDWVYKIPKTDILSILKSVINKQSDKELIPSHQHFYYPKQGGFQVITDAIYEQVKKHVKLNEPVDSLYHDDSQNKWIVNKKYHAGRVINTLPWTALSGALKPVPKISALLKTLKHNNLVVSLHEREYSHNWHWTFLPDENIREHREFYVNNYAPENKNKCVALETNFQRYGGIGKLPMAEHINQFAYPIPSKGYREAISKIRNYYEKKNMYGLGRWGEWEYYNSDICILKAMELIKKIENTTHVPTT